GLITYLSLPDIIRCYSSEGRTIIFTETKHLSLQSCYLEQELSMATYSKHNVR
ncbi:hypothetical protein L195_g060890, partial [Trifolium pratense]